MDKYKEQELLIRDFKENYYRKFGYVPLVIPMKSEIEDPSPIMTLDVLEGYFSPFLPRNKYRVYSLKQKDRKRGVVDLRFIFAFLGDKMGYSLTAMGKYLNRHHTSIIYYIEEFKNQMQTSETFRAKYKEIYTYIKQQHKPEPHDKLSTMVYFDQVWDQSKSTILS